MKNVTLLLIICLFIVGWFVFDIYINPATESVVEDVQAYQKKSLLPEDY